MTPAAVPTVGIVVNPRAGRDVRRLVSATGATSDHAKATIVRRVAEAALDAGAERVVVAHDTSGIGARAIDGLGRAASVHEIHLTGSRDDTIAAAAALREFGVGALVSLGGDGTCRDIAVGWPGAPLIAVSTGTNNVYPQAIDGTSAGWAAGLVASGAVGLAGTSTPTKRIAIEITDALGAEPEAETALVDLALVDATATGARAVLDAASVRTIVAAIARPATTGLSSIAGRLLPLDDEADGGVVVELGSGGRRIRVPLLPGRSAEVAVASVRRVDGGEPTVLHGPGVLAIDGERHRVLPAEAAVVVWIERTGPVRIDVDQVLAAAAAAQRFDVTDDAPATRGPVR